MEKKLEKCDMNAFKDLNAQKNVLVEDNPQLY